MQFLFRSYFMLVKGTRYHQNEPSRNIFYLKWTIYNSLHHFSGEFAQNGISIFSFASLKFIPSLYEYDIFPFG